MAAEPPSGRFELRAQFVGVVDLAVVGNDKAAAGRDHRLRPGRRQIDDRQPPMSEGQPGFRIEPDIAGIGAAMDAAYPSSPWRPRRARPGPSVRAAPTALLCRTSTSPSAAEPLQQRLRLIAFGEGCVPVLENPAQHRERLLLAARGRKRLRVVVTDIGPIRGLVPGRSPACRAPPRVFRSAAGSSRACQGIRPIPAAAPRPSVRTAAPPASVPAASAPRRDCSE